MVPTLKFSFLAEKPKAKNTGEIKNTCTVSLKNETSSWFRFFEDKNGLNYHFGSGKPEKITNRSFAILVRKIIQEVKKQPAETLVLNFSDFNFKSLDNYSEKWLTSTLIENIILANYTFNSFKSKPKKEKVTLSEVVIVGNFSSEQKAGFKRGEIVGNIINEAREVANTPASNLSPQDLGEVAKKLTKNSKIELKVLEEAELKKLKMHSLLAVGGGSKRGSRLIVAEYWGKGKPKAKTTKTEPSKTSDPLDPVLLVGKGITFDTGGLNVKPAGAMHEMHLDMSGGIYALATLVIAEKLNLKENIVAVVPTAENAISDTSMRAGDIVTAMNGKTIEITHTDAEGRLILADALTYATTFYNPSLIIDVATLTGASLVALGKQASAILSPDEALAFKTKALGEESGDLVWPLPLWKEYKEMIKSARADISNIAPDFSRLAGTIEGGTFLSFFVPEKTPWLHIDMAPRMVSAPFDKLSKGATGEPIRLLTLLLEKQTKENRDEKVPEKADTKEVENKK